MSSTTTVLKLVLFGIALACRLGYAQANLSGNAVSFNGTDAYLSAPAGTWFNGNFTIEAWVYERSYQSWSRVIDFSDGPNSFNVYLALSAGTSGQPGLGVFTNNNGLPTLQAGSQIPLNQWTHLAATLNGSTGTIYLNGKVVGVGQLNVPPGVVRTNDYIGRSAYAADGYADAEFDEIRIWNVARTQSQIEANMNHNLVGSETGLIGYWRLDEGSGSSASDATRNGQAVTLAGGASWTNSGALITRPLDYALIFSNEVVSIPHLAAQNAYPLTVMCWFVAPVGTGGGALVNKYVSGSFNGWQLALGSQLHAWYYRDGANFVGNTGGGFVADGFWHHGALVVDSAGGHVYVDGLLQSTVPWTGTPGRSTTVIPLSLGIYQGDSFFTGSIDEVSVWSTALSATQIQSYRYQALQGTEPNLVAYYRLNEGIGTNVFDYSTNANTGTLSSPPPSWTVSLGAATAPPALTLLAPSVGQGSATLNASVTPNGPLTTVTFAYGPTTSYGATNVFSNVARGDNAVTVSDFLTGLLGLTTYHYTVIASNNRGTVSGGDGVFQIGPVGAPVVTNQAATFGAATVTLSASVNPDGAPASVWFAYGPTANYGVTNFFGTLAAGYNGVTVTNLLTNPGAGVYHFTVLASNGSELFSGGDSVFGVPEFPFPATLAASSVGAGSATLNGKVTPGTLPVTAWFEWGLGSAYGQSTPPVLLGSGTIPVSISATLTGVPPGTYHFRAVATNDWGRTASWDRAFVLPLMTVTGGGIAYTNLLGAPFTPVTLIAPPIAVAGGGISMTAVLKADGRVTAWGRDLNAFGQTEVPADLSNVVAIACGDYITFAVKADGTLRSWGYNPLGWFNIPDGLSNVVAVAVGVIECLALKNDGTLSAWGANDYNEAGVASTLQNVIAIAAGADFFLALKADGTVTAFGNNGSYHQTEVPAGLATVVGISAGESHAVALKADGTVVGWGGNIYGQLNGTSSMNGGVAITSGTFGDHNLILRTNGLVACWGANYYNDCVPPAGLSTVVSIAAGEFCSLALKNDGTLVGWGSDGFGETDIPPGLSILSDPIILTGQIDPNHVGVYGFTAFSTNYMGAVNSVSGTIVVTAPVLQVVYTGPGSVQLSWSPNLPGYTLQESPDLTSGSWIDSASSFTNPVTVPIPNARTYYRLAHP